MKSNADRFLMYLYFCSGRDMDGLAMTATQMWLKPKYRNLSQWYGDLDIW